VVCAQGLASREVQEGRCCLGELGRVHSKSCIFSPSLSPLIIPPRERVAPKPETRNPTDSKLKTQRSALNTQHSTLNTQHSTLETKPYETKPYGRLGSCVGHISRVIRPPLINSPRERAAPQPGTLDTQHSTLNSQHSTLNTWDSILLVTAVRGKWAGKSTRKTQHSTTLNTQYSKHNTQHSTLKPTTQYSKTQRLKPSNPQTLKRNNQYSTLNNQSTLKRTPHPK
jgi:hypothetical protein